MEGFPTLPDSSELPNAVVLLLDLKVSHLEKGGSVSILVESLTLGLGYHRAEEMFDHLILSHIQIPQHRQTPEW